MRSILASQKSSQCFSDHSRAMEGKSQPMKKWKSIYYSLKMFPRDMSYLWAVLKIFFVQFHYQSRGRTVLDAFDQNRRDQPQKVALRHEGTKWTFQEIDEWSNQVARFLRGLGLKKGDKIALFLEGCVEYPCIWLGAAKYGIVTALINTNLTGTALQRCIEGSGAKYLIYSAQLGQTIEDIHVDLKKIVCFHVGKGKTVPFSRDFELEISTHSRNEICKKPKLAFDDVLLYIYTSGTTGLPKAAVITHFRFFMMTFALKNFLKIKKSDVVYTCLPLYHISGGILGITCSLILGGTTVIRSKFSASQYFSDCAKYGCTVGQYIGEMCRFMLSTPPSPADKQHNVRLMFGNGLRHRIWESFVVRFNVKEIGEIYGSTEGNANFVNAWNIPGAVGYIPWFLKCIYPTYLVKVDEETKQPRRNEKGFCVKCQPGETGLIIGKISQSILSKFRGYTDAQETNKKILYDVFKRGDSYFNSGDLLYSDKYGYLYFRDRTGDTFRWRGENVSTTEVEGIISSIVGNQKNVTVFGVEIPNVEGRAGMTVIVDDSKTINLTGLAKILKRKLAPYARPLFLRIKTELPMTGTLKVQKNKLQQEGYNPSVIADPLYFFDQVNEQFLTIDKDFYERIIKNEIKL